MKNITKIFLSFFVVCFMSSTVLADEGEPMMQKEAPMKSEKAVSMQSEKAATTEVAGSDISIEEAFAQGKVSGAIGSYVEIKDREGGLENFDWTTAYLTLKYETAKYKGLSLGARFFAHSEVSQNSGNGVNYYDVDIEKKYTLPELYLALDYLESSKVVVGRFDHRKISHIDDSHSEGGYIEFNELDFMDMRLGYMTRFAEIDYDDNEDFGRADAGQDLANGAMYGEDSEPYLLFFEGEMKPCEMLEVKPYIMYQDGYAGVYGLDAKVSKKLEEVTIGTKMGIQHVKADLAGFDDATNFSLFPYVKMGGLKAIVGYAKFDDGNAMNRPYWVAETYSVMDQQLEYGAAGTEAYFVKVKYALEKVWAHVAIAKKSYDYAVSRGDEVIEYEFQTGYKFTKNFDINLRLFDVQYDKVDGKDYQKLEGRLNFKF